MNRHRLLIIALCGFIAALALRVVSREVRLSRVIAPDTVITGGSMSAAARALRPNYPYSVIPGGAYSPAELRYVNEKDSLVRKHYADFDIRAARVVTLTDDRFQYVSFRLKNRIFWTRNKLRIPKGEVLLTDGRNYARTRCGNRLSSTPEGSTTSKQPSERALSLPAFRLELLSKGEVQMAPSPPLGELAQAFPVLPFDMPTLAPYLRPAGPVAVASSGNWPPIENYAPRIPIAGMYIPSSGTAFQPETLNSPRLVIPPGTPPVIAEVPEPASVYLFALTLLISLWLLTRMMRPSVNEMTKEDES